MAPYSRSSTSRGSSPTLGRWSGSEQRKSRLLRPPLQTHTRARSARRPGARPGASPPDPSRAPERLPCPPTSRGEPSAPPAALCARPRPGTPGTTGGLGARRHATAPSRAAGSARRPGTWTAASCPWPNGRRQPHLRPPTCPRPPSRGLRRAQRPARAARSEGLGSFRLRSAPLPAAGASPLALGSLRLCSAPRGAARLSP